MTYNPGDAPSEILAMNLSAYETPQFDRNLAKFPLGMLTYYNTASVAVTLATYHNEARKELLSETTEEEVTALVSLKPNLC